MSTLVRSIQTTPTPSIQTVKSLRGLNMIAIDEYMFVPAIKITREGLMEFYSRVTNALAQLQDDLLNEGHHMSDGAEKLRWGLCIQEVHEAAGFIRDVGIQARTSLQILVAVLTPFFCHSSTASFVIERHFMMDQLRIRAGVRACANLPAATPLPAARLVQHVPTASLVVGSALARAPSAFILL
ncbi:uncharacterized protein PAN0_002d1338 [Moesziomyces antarcticus]|uniref:uncharacterized protein n=1 Tax=Pseudozyma antarctica TaxID=84753 RepID=UPI00071988B7|nr:uncharacterized protein PAN0_002d1338 [Moesziomyces antarcticus]GAK63135.1 hypothetical protein PAN0_002d1338 [Moesziomyces antarcticus]